MMNMKHVTRLVSYIVLVLVMGLPVAGLGEANHETEIGSVAKRTIKMDIPVEDRGDGGIIAVDLDGDREREFVIAKAGIVACYRKSGERVWLQHVDIRITRKSEQDGLPGLHAPGFQAADVDGDGEIEVLFLTRGGAVSVLEGSTGNLKLEVRLGPTRGSEHWEHLVISSFRGKGDRDIFLQASNAKGYRMGRYIAAYSFDELMRSRQNAKPLWQRDDFIANAHSGARVADLNGDRRDEVLGGTIVSSEGEILLRIPLKGHIDSIFVVDVRPDIEGLEVVALEEGGGNQILPHSNRVFRVFNRAFNRLFPSGNHVFLYNHEKLIWKSHYKHLEPQNAAVGDFDPERPGLEIWCRSRFDTRQKPFVFDAQGQLISSYEMDNVAPKDWTDKGVEEISTIDWTGLSKQLAAAKERHKSGDICIFDPLSGKFIQRFNEKADRLYVADVYGDWREELIVLSGNELHIYQNTDKNSNPNHKRLWEENHYRKSKMTWNYYNP